jgi:hypothetical protein
MGFLFQTCIVQRKKRIKRSLDTPLLDPECMSYRCVFRDILLENVEGTIGRIHRCRTDILPYFRVCASDKNNIMIRQAEVADIVKMGRSVFHTT